jgi:hypothetical protein
MAKKRFGQNVDLNYPVLLERVKSLYGKLLQGDQIWRIFANQVIVYFRQFVEYNMKRPNSELLFSME